MDDTPNSDDQAKQYYANEITLIEATFLRLTQHYLDDQIPFTNLVDFCADAVLYRKAARFIDKEIYGLVCEIARLSETSNSINKKLEKLLKQNAID